MKKITYLLLLYLFLLQCDTLKQTPPLIPEPVIGSEEKLGDAQFNYWIHSPLHPKNNRPVQFQIDVEESGGIQKVELYIYEYELFYNEQGLPSKRRRNAGQWGLLHQWDLAGDQKNVQLSFDFARGFPAFTNVVYEFKVINTQKEITTRLASFDAGDSPWPNDKILLYATEEEPMTNNVNICFLPDTDYEQNLDKLLSDLESIIYEGYHVSNMIKPHKEKWTFYYNHQEINGFDLYQNYHLPNALPAFLRDSVIQGIDAFALIHQLDYSDGAYLTSNISFLSNNLFTSEGDHIGTLVHETAHAIFGLSDEYNGCGCFDGPYGNNMFRSLEACQQFQVSIGNPNGSCTLLEDYLKTNVWMAEHPALFESQTDCQNFNISQSYPNEDCGLFIDGNGKQWYRANRAVCIMQDDGDEILRPFQKACAGVIQNFYRIMEEELLALSTSREEVVSNHFGYQPVILMELDAQGMQLDLNVKKVNYGIPTKNWKAQQDLKIDLKNNLGITRHQININRPGRVLIHSANQDLTEEIQHGKCLLNVPFDKNLAKANCNWKREGVKNPQLESIQINQIFDLEKAIKERSIRFR